jgi:hypothetical protein
VLHFLKNLFVSEQLLFCCIAFLNKMVGAGRDASNGAFDSFIGSDTTGVRPSVRDVAGLRAKQFEEYLKARTFRSDEAFSGEL